MEGGKGGWGRRVRRRRKEAKGVQDSDAAVNDVSDDGSRTDCDRPSQIKLLSSVA